jgi:hypothetical protein
MFTSVGMMVLLKQRKVNLGTGQRISPQHSSAGMLMLLARQFANLIISDALFIHRLAGS